MLMDYVSATVTVSAANDIVAIIVNNNHIYIEESIKINKLQ